MDNTNDDVLSLNYEFSDDDDNDTELLNESITDNLYDENVNPFQSTTIGIQDESHNYEEG